jgi:hypothetical protein
MNRNYLVAPRLHEIGFLKNQNAYRARQGLASQDLAGTCQQPSKINGQYSENIGDICSSENLYMPYNYAPNARYGGKNVPNDCPCARFVQAP